MKKSEISEIGPVQSTKVTCIKVSHIEPVLHLFIVYFYRSQEVMF